MYSSLLRTSRVWGPIIPSLSSPKGLNLTERKLDSCHISVPVNAQLRGHGNDIHEPRHVHFLLLTISALCAGQLEQTKAQLFDFTSLARDSNSAVVFLFKSQHGNGGPDIADAESSALQAYFGLLKIIRGDSELSRLPILPLDKAENLAGMLTACKNAAADCGITIMQHEERKNTRKYLGALLSCATTAPAPWSEEDGLRYIDSFSSLRKIAEVAISDKVKEKFRRIFGEDKASGAIEFWEDEWVAE